MRRFRQACPAKIYHGGKSTRHPCRMGRDPLGLHLRRSTHRAIAGAPMRMCGAAVIVAAFFWGCSAQAALVDLGGMTLGYTYYNRPNATWADHDREVASCAGEAAKVRTPVEILRDINAPAVQENGGLVGAALAPFVRNAARHGLAGASLENCMVVRGWRVVRLPSSEGAFLANLTQPELKAALAPWIGASLPHGEIVRVWANDAIRASTTRFTTQHPHDNDGQLSLKATTDQTLLQFKVQYGGLEHSKTAQDWPKKVLKPSQFGDARPDSAILLIRLKGVGLYRGTTLAFSRMESAPSDEASIFDLENADVVELVVGPIGAKSAGDFRAVAVKPGRWRLHSLGGIDMVNFCLGSPSFEAAEGEITYLGTFDLASEDLSPDLSLQPAQAHLAGFSSGRPLRPAIYTNGSRGRCGDAAMYAIEFSGAQPEGQEQDVRQ